MPVDEELDEAEKIVDDAEEGGLFRRDLEEAELNATLEACAECEKAEEADEAEKAEEAD